MLYLAMPLEVETSPLALKCWQAGKTVVVPKVSWDQRRMLADRDHLAHDRHHHRHQRHRRAREPAAGNPVPADMIDLVIVPGLGFSPTATASGAAWVSMIAFWRRASSWASHAGWRSRKQIVDSLPVLDHDVSLLLLATDQGIRRFASHVIEQK